MTVFKYINGYLDSDVLYVKFGRFKSDLKSLKCIKGYHTCVYKRNHVSNLKIQEYTDKSGPWNYFKTNSPTLQSSINHGRYKALMIKYKLFFAALANLF